MSNSCTSVAPCNPDSVPDLLAQLAEINRESRVTAINIKDKLFGEEKCNEKCCDPIEPNGYIGDLRRLVRDTGEVMEMLHVIANAL